MPEAGTSIHREVRVAAIVAFIGSGLFLLAGAALGGSVVLMVSAVVLKYPGASVRNAGQEFNNIMRLVGLSTAILIGIGIVGTVVGVGLLRVRSWARDAALAWSFGTTLLFVIILATPQSLFGARPNPTGILLFMVFLLPVNAWWLMLFTRQEVMDLFGPATSAPRKMEIPGWLKENFLGKSILVVGAAAIVLFTTSRIIYRNSPMREIERSRDALAGIHSWHYHTVRYIQNQPPETIDMDTVCPNFQHRTSSIVDARGETQVHESIHYFNHYYNHVGDQWPQAKTQAGFTDPGIVECDAGPIGSDENSLPLASVIENGTVKRGELKQVDGVSCREYQISTLTPHDPAERIFEFTICINQLDHLPRETRRTPPFAVHEGVTEFSQWNVLNEPDLPPEIARQ